jgi:hypothetical protein
MLTHVLDWISRAVNAPHDPDRLPPEDHPMSRKRKNQMSALKDLPKDWKAKLPPHVVPPPFKIQTMSEGKNYSLYHQDTFVCMSEDFDFLLKRARDLAARQEDNDIITATHTGWNDC